MGRLYLPETIPENGRKNFWWWVSGARQEILNSVSCFKELQGHLIWKNNTSGRSKYCGASACGSHGSTTSGFLWWTRSEHPTFCRSLLCLVANSPTKPSADWSWGCIWEKPCSSSLVFGYFLCLRSGRRCLRIWDLQSSHLAALLSLELSGSLRSFSKHLKSRSHAISSQKDSIL